jgi:hypothetical protein
MTDAIVSLTASCPCGHLISWPENATADTELFCEGCEERIGTYGEFNARAHAKVREFGRAAILDALRDISLPTSPEFNPND